MKQNILDRNRWRTGSLSVWKYAESLPVNDLSMKVSLGEVGTIAPALKDHDVLRKSFSDIPRLEELNLSEASKATGVRS